HPRAAEFHVRATAGIRGHDATAGYVVGMTRIVEEFGETEAVGGVEPDDADANPRFALEAAAEDGQHAAADEEAGEHGAGQTDGRVGLRKSPGGSHGDASARSVGPGVAE